MNTLSRIIFGAALPVALAACDPVAPFFLRNGLLEPITVQATYEGGTRSEGVLAPGQSLAFMHPAAAIDHVVVISDGQKLYDLNKQLLLEMRDSVSDPRQVTWNIEVHGIKPLTRVELKQIEGK